mmetsp:Transcript_11741/g.37506  ORF Transcript_11741/g.37506 Transcript_11741/m.37506 type:complete len:247 (+) Transcript_11741:4238-4978(+)
MQLGERKQSPRRRPCGAQRLLVAAVADVHRAHGTHAQRAGAQRTVHRVVQVQVGRRVQRTCGGHRKHLALGHAVPTGHADHVTAAQVVPQIIPLRVHRQVACPMARLRRHIRASRRHQLHPRVLYPLSHRQPRAQRLRRCIKRHSCHRHVVEPKALNHHIQRAASCVACHLLHIPRPQHVRLHAARVRGRARPQVVHRGHHGVGLHRLPRPCPRQPPHLSQRHGARRDGDGCGHSANVDRRHQLDG